MQTTTEPLGEDRVRLRVEVPAADVDHAFEHALHDLATSAKIPGFRKGKVPPGVIRSRLGSDVVIQEALDGHLSRWYGRAMEMEALEAVRAPSIDWDEPLTEGQPWTFTAEVQVAPAAILPDPLELEAPRHEPEITREMIDARLERMRALSAQLDPVEDAAAENGMLAVIDFSGSVGNRKIKNGAAHDYMVEIGSGRLLDPLEDALVGMRPGETREIETVLPEEGPDPKLNGKTATFTITLKELKRRVLPELGDELAESISEFETLKELEADIERQLRERADAEADGVYREAVLHALGQAADVEVPDVMIERRVRDRAERFARGLARQGMPLDVFLQQMGQTPEEFLDRLRPEAAELAREELALRALADREQIAPDDAELEAWVREQAAEEKDPEATARRVMESPSARESVRQELRLKLALDRAVELCKPVPAERPDDGDVIESTGAHADATDG
jgi:trigger factor